ncbi:MAG TPA: MFS transporter [Steroidobacteraceae bacterium]|nr:MFS transporter [Steroidobacteraceae bacterium]
MQAQASLDDAPFSAFHRRIAIYSCGGPFCDGYILGIIAAALGPLSSEIGLTAGWQGMVGAAALVGMFVGGLVFGYLTDLLGRRVMYSADLLVLIVASAAQFWVHDRVSLLVLRFVLGLAVGADYPIASALLSEFAPKRQRGMLLAAMIGAWWLGYTISFIAGYALGNEGLSWRWMLASSAIPAALVSLLRWGTPESPRWLISKGRTGEAQALIQRHIGSGYGLQESPSAKTAYRTIFRGPYLGRTAFVCVFWSCQVVPTFAIYTFAPDLLRAFGSPDPAFGAAILSLFFLAGVIPAVLLIDRIGRRPVLTIPFAVTGVTLLLLGWLPRGASILVEVCFIVFAIFNAGSSVLQWVYPSELFPTEVRATALGFGTAVSRIGAAVGTFLFPIGLTRLGVAPLMTIVAAICGLGWLVSVRFAPETRGMSLQAASAAEVG